MEAWWRIYASLNLVITWSLIYIAACRWLGDKLLTEPTPTYCEVDPWEQTSNVANVFENAFADITQKTFRNTFWKEKKNNFIFIQMSTIFF